MAHQPCGFQEPFARLGLIMTSLVVEASGKAASHPEPLRCVWGISHKAEVGLLPTDLPFSSIFWQQPSWPLAKMTIPASYLISCWCVLHAG